MTDNCEKMKREKLSVKRWNFCADEVAWELCRNMSEELPVEGLAPVFGVDPSFPVFGVDPCRPEKRQQNTKKGL